MLARIGLMVDVSSVLPLVACKCSVMNAPVLSNECTCVHFWTLSAKLPSKSEHPRLFHTQPAQRLDYVCGVAAIWGSSKAGVSSTGRLRPFVRIGFRYRVIINCQPRKCPHCLQGPFKVFAVLSGNRSSARVRTPCLGRASVSAQRQPLLIEVRDHPRVT